jgi:putative PIN family toxin of toxin-antitoxin system
MMIKAVIDTNVLVSAALSNAGSPAKIIELISDGKIDVYFDDYILSEYKEVFSSRKFSFSIERQSIAIELLSKNGKLIKPDVSDIPLIDERDRAFYDTANTIDAYLVTGNIKHYPDESKIMTPAQFLELFDEN